MRHILCGVMDRATAMRTNLWHFKRLLLLLTMIKEDSNNDAMDRSSLSIISKELKKISSISNMHNPYVSGSLNELWRISSS